MKRWLVNVIAVCVFFVMESKTVQKDDTFQTVANLCIKGPDASILKHRGTDFLIVDLIYDGEAFTTYFGNSPDLELGLEDWSEEKLYDLTQRVHRLKPKGLELGQLDMPGSVIYRSAGVWPRFAHVMQTIDDTTKAKIRKIQFFWRMEHQDCSLFDGPRPIPAEASDLHFSNVYWVDITTDAANSLCGPGGTDLDSLIKSLAKNMNQITESFNIGGEEEAFDLLKPDMFKAIGFTRNLLLLQYTTAAENYDGPLFFDGGFAVIVDFCSGEAITGTYLLY